MAELSATKHRPGAVDHHQLMRGVVEGHAAIANAVAEYTAAKQQRLEDARALYGAERAAGRPADLGGATGAANPAIA